MKNNSKTIIIFVSLARSLILFRGPLIKKLMSMNHKVITCAPLDKKVKKKLNEIGCQFIPISMNRRGFNVFEDIKYFFNLLKIINKINPDIILSYTIKPVLYSSIAGYLNGVKNIFSTITGVGYIFYDGGIIRKLFSKFLSLILKIAFNTNKCIFFQNRDDRDLFFKKNIISKKNRIKILNGSGVDLDFYHHQKPTINPMKFLIIGRLLIEKGIKEFTEAAKIIKQKHSDCLFEIISMPENGPSSFDENQLINLDRKGIINYHGYKDDVRPYLESCSVYVLPSYREGTPRTVLEAMSVGKPIITTDAPGCKETVKHGINGYLVPVGDYKELAKAMEKFILNKNLIVDMGLKSREIACEKYDVNKVNSEIISEIGLYK